MDVANIADRMRRQVSSTWILHVCIVLHSRCHSATANRLEIQSTLLTLNLRCSSVRTSEAACAG